MFFKIFIYNFNILISKIKKIYFHKFLIQKYFFIKILYTAALSNTHDTRKKKPKKKSLFNLKNKKKSLANLCD
jgi:hypothetical protein